MSRKTLLVIATVAIQLVCLYLAFRNQSGFLGPIVSGYIIAVLVVVMTLHSGSETGCRFFRLLAIIAGIPALLMLSAYFLSHDDPNTAAKVVAMAFLAAFAVQLFMVIAFKPAQPGTNAAPAHLEGNAALIQDIADHGRAGRAEVRRQQERGNRMKAERELDTATRRIQTLEAENEKLRQEVRKLRTVLADPFHDPIPMEEKI